MFTRYHHRIAAGYVFLTALTMLALGAYFVNVLRSEGLRTLEGHLASQAAQAAAEAAYLWEDDGPQSLAEASAAPVPAVRILRLRFAAA